MIKAKFRLSKLKKLFVIILSIMVILSLFPAKKAAASVNEVKDDTDLAKINTYKFNLNIIFYFKWNFTTIILHQNLHIVKSNFYIKKFDKIYVV